MQVKLSTETSLRSRSRKSSASGRTVEVREKKTPFMEILEEVLPAEDIETRDLQKKWEQLPEFERRLLDHRSSKNFDEYKELVRTIASATLKRNMVLEKYYRKSRGGDKMELRIVRILDERLQAMTGMIHSPQNSAFSLLKQMDEIRGLLLDIRADH